MYQLKNEWIKKVAKKEIKKNEKQCSTGKLGCGKIKPFSEFPKDSTSKDGLKYICSDCLKKWREGQKKKAIKKVNKKK